MQREQRVDSSAVVQPKADPVASGATADTGAVVPMSGAAGDPAGGQVGPKSRLQRWKKAKTSVQARARKLRQWQAGRRLTHTSEAAVPPISLADQKLAAEIEEIRSRSKPPDFIEEWIVGPTKYLGIVVPIAAAVIAAGVEWNEYLDQRERLARFDVGEEVIKLATQLSDTNKPDDQRLAAYELAWFGRPAVFLLFERLVAEDRVDVRNAVVMALSEIFRSEMKPPGLLSRVSHSVSAIFGAQSQVEAAERRGVTKEPSVLTVLAQSSAASIGAALTHDKPNTDAILERLTALGEVAAAIVPEDPVGASRYRSVLQALRTKIEDRPSTQLSDVLKKQLTDAIDRQLSVPSS